MYTIRLHTRISFLSTYNIIIIHFDQEMVHGDVYLPTFVAPYIYASAKISAQVVPDSYLTAHEDRSFQVGSLTQAPGAISIAYARRRVVTQLCRPSAQEIWEFSIRL